MNTQYQDQNNDLISRSWLMEQLEGLGDTRLIKRNFIALVTNAPDAEQEARTIDKGNTQAVPTPQG